MTIALVSQEYPPQTGGGGIGTQTYLRAHGLSARGHKIHVIAASWDAQQRTYQDFRANIHRVGEPQLNVAGYEPSTYWLAYSHAVAAKLTELEKTIRFDVIQFPEYGGEGFIYQSDTFANRRAKFVVQMHGPLAMFAEYWGWPDKKSALMKIGGFMEKTSLEYTDKLLASSRHTADYCAKAYGIDTQNAGIVYSGIDIDKFSPRPPADNDPRSPRILFVGGLSGGKGITDLLRALGRLKARFPQIILRAIGKATTEQQAVIDLLIKEHNLQSHYETPGFVPHENLPEHYAWCDFFAAPSVYEGGPGNVYLEAMACGRPVIACNTGGIPEVVDHNLTGLLVSPHNLDELQSAIETLAIDAIRRRQMGAQARARVIADFSVKTYLDKCERYYQEVL
jgi:glycosyltransferase involved in cell wall biosynthesis